MCSGSRSRGASSKPVLERFWVVPLDEGWDWAGRAGVAVDGEGLAGDGVAEGEGEVCDCCRRAGEVVIERKAMAF